MNELHEIRQALEEVGSAAAEELRRLNSPHAELLEDCFNNVCRALRLLQLGDSLQSAKELATRASERALRLRK